MSKPYFGEHNLQVASRKWCRAVITEPHEFLSFDRTRKQSDMQHIYEAARGIVGGTADTALLLSNKPPVWIEFKVRPNKPTNQQEDFAVRVKRLGHPHSYIYSVEELFGFCVRIGIRLAGNAMIAAMDADARLEAARIKAKGPQKPRRARKPPPSPEEWSAASQRGLREMLEE